MYIKFIYSRHQKPYRAIKKPVYHMEDSSGLHPNNPALGTKIMKGETCSASKREKNCACAQSWCRQVLSSLGSYKKSDKFLDHLRQKTFIASFREETS